MGLHVSVAKYGRGLLAKSFRSEPLLRHGTMWNTIIIIRIWKVTESEWVCEILKSRFNSCLNLTHKSYRMEWTIFKGAALSGGLAQWLLSFCLLYSGTKSLCNMFHCSKSIYIQTVPVILSCYFLMGKATLQLEDDSKHLITQTKQLTTSYCYSKISDVWN